MPSPSEIDSFNRALAVWRQGDIILGNAPPFVFPADMSHPLSAQAQQLADAGAGGIEVVDAPGPGIVVVSQTCDLIRDCAARPYAEVCPLVELPREIMDQVRRWRRPQYAALGGLGAQSLAVDFDRTMTIEKALLVPFTESRIRGILSEREAKMFADAAARKRNRAALPDEFVRALNPIRKRILEKHGNKSLEGIFLSNVVELRVRSDPSWGAAEARIEMLFVYDRLGDIPLDADEHIESLVRRFHASSTYPALTGRAVSLETLPTMDYLQSYRLDLEHVTISTIMEHSDKQ